MNKTNQISSKDKFFEMREKEQSIEENPIRYGKEQYKKGVWDGKMKAYDRMERVIRERRIDADNQDAQMQATYQYMADFISILRGSES